MRTAHYQGLHPDLGRHPVQDAKKRNCIPGTLKTIPRSHTHFGQIRKCLREEGGAGLLTGFIAVKRSSLTPKTVTILFVSFPKKGF